ncbi:hypothetical protein [Nocardioides aquiterrae]|uniref:Uncharacterized protein n=1 Tax=Nocardioides aquiterrae TaxID=203799 RepID=A0ABN1UD63_9ACTN
MIAALNITDPTTALMLAHLEVDELGSVRARRADLRRRQRRFHAAAKLRKLLA